MGMVFSAQRELFRGLNQPFPSPVLTHLNDDSGNVILNAATGKLTSALAYPGLNTSGYGLRVALGTPPGVVGGLPPSWEFQGINANNNHTTASIIGATVIPSGSYSGDPTWPDGGLAGYALTYSTLKSAIGVLSFAGVGVAGGFSQAFNGISTNCELGKAGSDCVGSNLGWNAAHIYGAETDVQIANTSGGGTMTGDIVGMLTMLSATPSAVSTLSSSAAFRAAQSNGGKWNIGFDSFGGAANIAMSVGPLTQTGPSNSQSINFTSLGGGGGGQTALMFLDNASDLVFINGAGSGQTFALNAAYPQLSFSMGITGNSGMKLKNTTASVGVATENLILETGSLNSNVSLGVVDGGDITLSTGLGNLLLSPASPNGVKITRPLTVSLLTGYMYAHNSSIVTASATVPTTDLSGTLACAQFPALTGDVTTSANSCATTIANAAVTYAKIQNISVTARFLGRKTAGAGSTEELSAADAKTILAYAFSDLSGTASASQGGTGQAGGYAIGDLLYASGATALSKLADVAIGSVLRSGGVATAPAWGKINLSTDLDANTLPAANTAALTGDVTKSAGSNVTTVAAIGGKAVSLGANLTTTGAGAPTLAFPASSFTYTFQGSSYTVLGRDTVDTLTNKTFDTAGAGNVFRINGTAISAVTGTGAAVLANIPAFVGGINVFNSSTTAAIHFGTNFNQGNTAIAAVNYEGNNAASANTVFGQETVAVDDATAGNETAHFNIVSRQAATLANRLSVGAGIYASTLADPGAAKANFAGYSVSNTAGVSCTVNTPAHLTVVNGIVTVCN
jgi:hypothetical protein